MVYKAKRKRCMFKGIIILGFLILFQVFMPVNAAAEEKDIIIDTTTDEITLTCGDSGKFILDQSLADSYYGDNSNSGIWDDGTWDDDMWDDDTWDDDTWDDDMDDTDADDTGLWDDAGWFFSGIYGDGNYDDGEYNGDDEDYVATPPDTSEDNKIISSFEYSSSDSSALEVTTDGSYIAKLGKDVILYITAYNSEETVVYSGSFRIVVKADLSAAVLSETSHTEYWYDNSKPPLSVTVVLNGAKGLVSSGGNTEFDYRVSSGLEADCSFSGEEIVIYAYSAGSGAIEIELDNKTFSFTLNVKRVMVSGSNSLYLVKGKTKQMKLKGTSQKTVWTSSNPSVVKITKNGKMKGRRPGNAIITAATGSGRTGCVVSVVAAGRLKVIKRAIWIGKHWKYDQQKRMQNGYYDCSALVWKAYLKEKRYLMSKNYAPTAADLGKWCQEHGKIIKGSNSKNLAKLKMKPGAVMFETGSQNGRFKGIYHVEMFTGYTFEGYGYDGKAIIGTKWANRPDNYYGSGDLWAQL